MPDMSAKLEIMELFSRYLLCLDERRFDIDSFAEIFTENAEVIIPSKSSAGRECRGLHEIKDIHAALYRLLKSSHHVSSDYIFDSITDVTAEVRCNISGYYNSFDVDSGSMAAGVINFSAVHTAEGWKIQRLRRKTKFNYNLSILIKNQEEFIS